VKLVTYSNGGQVALGALLHDDVVDLRRACRAAPVDSGKPEEHAKAVLHPPNDLLGLLQGGQAALAAATRALAFAERQRAAGQLSELFAPVAEIQLLAPIQRPGKTVCVGLNYRSHLAEIGEPPSEYPILFYKPATSIIGPGQAIRLPRVSQQIDFEGELAVVIGRRGKHIPQRNALSFVAGYTCANDVSAHDIEFRTSQWDSGKMMDTFCPLGPALVTSDEIADPATLRLQTFVNEEKVQDASVSEMIFAVPFLISYISSLATLEPGDVILTGTPAGIGCNRKPMVFLKSGDRVSVQINGIGTLTNPVAAEEES
jgi:acylpyruvate hydrolase